MEEIPNLILFCKGFERLKVFTTAYLLLISGILTNIIVHQAYGFYLDKHMEITLSAVINFIFSPQAMIFITVYVFIGGSNYLLLPLLIKSMTYLIRFAFVLAGNLFFYFIYLILTKILRLKAERKFSFIGEEELLNLILQFFRACQFKNGRTFRHTYFGYLKWFVLNIIDRSNRTASNVYLMTAILILTWIVIHQYQFFELAPVIYSIVTGMSLCYIADAIIVSWIVRKSDYFLDIILYSVNKPDSLNQQQNPDE